MRADVRRDWEGERRSSYDMGCKLLTIPVNCPWFKLDVARALRTAEHEVEAGTSENFPDALAKSPNLDFLDAYSNSAPGRLAYWLSVHTLPSLDSVSSYISVASRIGAWPRWHWRCGCTAQIMRRTGPRA